MATFPSRFTKRDRAVKEQEILEFGKTYDENGNVDKNFGIWISTSLSDSFHIVHKCLLHQVSYLALPHDAAPYHS